MAERVRVQNVKSAGMYGGRVGIRLGPGPSVPSEQPGAPARVTVQVLLDGESQPQLFDPYELQDLGPAAI